MQAALRDRIILIDPPPYERLYTSTVSPGEFREA
jgi:hypothetical protein